MSSPTTIPAAFRQISDDEADGPAVAVLVAPFPRRRSPAAEAEMVGWRNSVAGDSMNVIPGTTGRGVKGGGLGAGLEAGEGDLLAPP